MVKDKLLILEKDIKQKICRDPSKSKYKIKFLKNRITIPEKIEEEVNSVWKKFKENDKLIAKNNITCFYKNSQSNSCDFVTKNLFKYVQAFGKTEKFQKYVEYARINGLVALSSMCIIETSDRKIVLGIKKNMSNKISSFSGYIQKEDISGGGVDIWKYLSRTIMQELNIENSFIREIIRIGKIYSPKILDKNKRLNNHVYNNVFLIKLRTLFSIRK